MTLEEAIKHAEEKAKRGGECGEDHAQLAEWLKELQKLRTVKTEKRKEESAQNVPKEDLISRKAAIEAHYEYCNKHPDAGFPVWSLKILEDLPSTQPEITEEEVREWCYKRCLTVIDNALYLEMRSRWSASAQSEIVRCGDCKYFKVEYAWNCASYPICEVSPQRIITPDDYCSFAERRTDG